MSGNVEKRFRRKLSEKRPNGCIEWLGWKNNSGYGMLKSSDRPYRHLLAHRVAYELHKGKITEGLDVMHTCDNRICVNPEHLKLGTRQENVQDMLDKGRQRKSQLPFSEILEMRRSGMTQQEIANNLNVSRPLISMILAGKITCI